MLERINMNESQDLMLFSVCVCVDTCVYAVYSMFYSNAPFANATLTAP